MAWVDVLEMQAHDAALEIVLLREQVESLTADNDVLRGMVHAALDQLHALQAQNERLSICLRRDLSERYGPIVSKRPRRAA